MALQTSSLAEACSPFEIKDGRELAEFLEDLRGENPRIHDDFELVSRETHAFLRARGVRYRGTVEKWVDYEDDRLRRVFIGIYIADQTVEENHELLGDLVTHLAGKRLGFGRWILIDIFRK